MGTLIIIIIIVFFYKWNDTVEEFKLPWYYLCLICLLLAQKMVTFILKMIVFGPVFLISYCYKKCKRSCNQKPMRLSDDLLNNPKNDNSLNMSAIFGTEGLNRLQTETWHRNLELDKPLSNKHQQGGQNQDSEQSKELYTYKKFYKRKYLCRCTYRFHLRIYPLLQWLSLMHNDRNDYIHYSECEYCGEPFKIYEKVVFPKNCRQRNLNANKSEFKPHSHFSDSLNPEELIKNKTGYNQQLESPRRRLNQKSARSTQRDFLNSEQASSNYFSRTKRRPHYFHVCCIDLISFRQTQTGYMDLTPNELQECQVCKFEQLLEKEEIDLRNQQQQIAEEEELNDEYGDENSRLISARNRDHYGGGISLRHHWTTNQQLEFHQASPNAFSMPTVGIDSSMDVLSPNLDGSSSDDNESEQVPQQSAFGVSVHDLFEEERKDQAYDSSSRFMGFDKTEGQSSITVSLYDEQTQRKQVNFLSNDIRMLFEARENQYKDVSMNESAYNEIIQKSGSETHTDDQVDVENMDGEETKTEYDDSHQLEFEFLRKGQQVTPASARLRGHKKRVSSEKQKQKQQNAQQSSEGRGLSQGSVLSEVEMLQLKKQTSRTDY